MSGVVAFMLVKMENLYNEEEIIHLRKGRTMYEYVESWGIYILLFLGLEENNVRFMENHIT
jgi:hypothetical protein